MSFSKRYNFEKEKIIQINDMDNDLRTSLLNIIYLHFFKDQFYPQIDFLVPIWIKILKKDVSELDYLRNAEQKFRILKREFFNNEWYKIYDIIELIIHTSSSSDKISLIKNFNDMLEMENSAYRIINEVVVPITDEIEIQEIEKVFCLDNKFKSVKDQINQALILLSDKKDPDYKNSFKESISAVESLCKIILNEDKISLGQALRKIENDNKYEINGSLKAGFFFFFCFASTEVRHGSIKEDEIDYDLSKFMVVACCALINYLISKNRSNI